MNRLTFEEMQRMQEELREKYAHLWGGLDPEKGVGTLLWLYGELAEAGDILKKEGSRAVMENGKTRAHFIEELCDALMYLNDLMLCYGIKPDELEQIYREKHRINMSRW